MTNLERYNKIFMDVFRKKEEELKGLKYRGFDLWDSIGHMDLVAELEEAFEIRLETSDMLDLTSYEKGMEVLAGYGVVFEGAEKA
ncbi:acyl carrier protein [[Clostridium] symbiosum]|uniref:acyl carrier protein n=1 Tax=Clostridium symbiosum TaxID=1512 RepID=UPI001D069963|nr:acyl carrier protein [[Clostridium] symbiosum]MCB6610118.1 acyl carrier protein [[Clostridium] symbiosum]MCB6930540.1 acyl carrier protein [[Clostridium] symbiosum]